MENTKDQIFDRIIAEAQDRIEKEESMKKFFSNGTMRFFHNDVPEPQEESVANCQGAIDKDNNLIAYIQDMRSRPA